MALPSCDVQIYMGSGSSGLSFYIKRINRLTNESNEHLKGIYADSLKAEIKKLSGNFQMEGMNGLKLFQKISLIAYTKSGYTCCHKPFFVLYNLRSFLDHEMSNAEAGEIINSCYERLDSDKDRNFDKLTTKELNVSLSRILQSQRFWPD